MDATPVSYTHLDVYKRQVFTPSWCSTIPLATGNFLYTFVSITQYVTDDLACLHKGLAAQTVHLKSANPSAVESVWMCVWISELYQWNQIESLRIKLFTVFRTTIPLIIWLFVFDYFLWRSVFGIYISKGTVVVRIFNTLYKHK